MASKAPKTAPEAPAPEAPYVIPAPGTARITEQLQLALQAQGLRRCAGMPKIGHPQHDAPIDNFNLNSARLLGRARLCKDARKAYNAVLSETAKANAPAKAPKAPKAKAPKPEPIKTAKPRAAKAPKPTAAPAPEATTAPAPDDVAEVQPSAGTKAAAAAAARAQVRRQAKEAAAAAAAKRAARRAPAPTADVEPEAEAVVAAADGAADDLPF
jgi:outer membrane biosynthesis protein TonB